MKKQIFFCLAFFALLALAAAQKNETEKPSETAEEPEQNKTQQQILEEKVEEILQALNMTEEEKKENLEKANKEKVPFDDTVEKAINDLGFGSKLMFTKKELEQILEQLIYKDSESKDVDKDNELMQKAIKKFFKGVDSIVAREDLGKVFNEETMAGLINYLFSSVDLVSMLRELEKEVVAGVKEDLGEDLEENAEENKEENKGENKENKEENKGEEMKKIEDRYDL